MAVLVQAVYVVWPLIFEEDIAHGDAASFTFAALGRGKRAWSGPWRHDRRHDQAILDVVADTAR